ncbi:MAG: phosphoribosyl transferase [Opitutus sp.]|nr:phosphoribosyl transferase [Opitutus sp.]
MQTANRYADRTQAGQVLATELLSFAHRHDVIVLGLARGGVPVAAEIARALHVEFDVFPVQKLVVPADPDTTFGAIAPQSVHVIDNTRVQQLQLSPDELADQVLAAEAALALQVRRYWRHRAPLPLEGRRIILADDGAASGWTLRAALAALRTHGPQQIVVAVPVGDPQACRELAAVCDRVICPLQPAPFLATGLWYVHFAAVTDDEVLEWLEAAHTTRSLGGRLNFFR